MRLRQALLIGLLTALVTPDLRGQSPDPRAAILTAVEGGRYDEARSRLAAAQGELSASALLYLEGRVEFAEERFEDARELFAEAAEADHRSAEALVWEGNASAQIAMRASVLTKLSHGRRALDAWERALAVDPANVQALENIVTYHLSVPGWLGGGKERATPFAVRLAGLEPYTGGLALSSVAAGQPRADSILMAVARAYPDSAAPYRRLVARLQDRSEFDAAEALTRERLERLPNDRTGLFYRGRGAALSARDVDGGIASLVRFVGMPADTSDGLPIYGGYFRLGQLSEVAKDTAAAVEAYRSVLRLRPEHEAASSALKRLVEVR